MAAISPFLDRIRSSGAELVVIGHGSVEDARAFRDEQKMAVPLLTDPSRQSYCALHMRRGLASVLSLLSWREASRLLAPAIVNRESLAIRSSRAAWS